MPNAQIAPMRRASCLVRGLPKRRFREEHQPPSDPWRPGPPHRRAHRQRSTSGPPADPAPSCNEPGHPATLPKYSTWLVNAGPASRGGPRRAPVAGLRALCVGTALHPGCWQRRKHPRFRRLDQPGKQLGGRRVVAAGLVVVDAPGGGNRRGVPPYWGGMGPARAGPVHDREQRGGRPTRSALRNERS